VDYIEIENQLGRWKLPRAFCSPKVGGTWDGSTIAGVIGLVSEGLHLPPPRPQTAPNPIVRMMLDGLLFVAPDTVLCQERYVAETPAIILDVGAHIGSYSVLLSQILTTHKIYHKIYAVEASPELFPCLKYSLEKNVDPQWGQSWSTNAAAVSTENSGKTTFFPAIQENASGCAGQNAHSLEQVEGFTIPTVDLDSLNFEACDVLKIDCEGGDLDVIKGATKLIGKCRPLILFECSCNAISGRIVTPHSGSLMSGFDPTVPEVPAGFDELAPFFNILTSLNYIIFANPYWRNGDEWVATPLEKISQFVSHIENQVLSLHGKELLEGLAQEALLMSGYFKDESRKEEI